MMLTMIIMMTMSEADDARQKLFALALASHWLVKDSLAYLFVCLFVIQLISSLIYSSQVKYLNVLDRFNFNGQTQHFICISIDQIEQQVRFYLYHLDNICSNY